MARGNLRIFEEKVLWALIYSTLLYSAPKTNFGHFNIIFSLNQPHWADSVIELRCQSVCLFVCVFAPSDAVFFEASHLP